MSKEIEIKVNWDSSEYKEFRRGTVGSSEIAAICGLSRYSSPLRIWSEKTGKVEGFKGNQNTNIGKLSEPVVAELFHYEHPEEGIPLPAQQCYAHDNHNWAVATPDYWLYKVLPADMKMVDEDILEIKTGRIESLPTWEDGDVPNDYVMQVNWQLGVLGKKKAWIAALIGGFEFRAQRLEFSEELWNQSVQIAEQFLDFVKKDIPPNAGPGDSELIRNLITPEEKTVALPLEQSLNINKWLELRQQKSKLSADVKYIDEEMKKIQNNIVLLAGGASIATCGDTTISMKETVVEPYQNKGYRFIRFNVKE